MPGISSSQFPFTESIWYLAMVVIGGMGSIMGVFIGAIVVRGLGFLIGENVVPWLTDLAAPGGALYGILPVNMYSRAGGVFPLLLSVVFILFLMYAPQGVAQWWGKFKLSYRFWPFSF
jgi:branched-chain amino acid transport system permease protein